MNVVVKKKALKMLIKKMSEDRSYRSARIDHIEGKEEPIQPNPQMSVQLSVEAPPVGDPDYVPASNEELARSASVISLEVPSQQIEYFYRMLHKLLDKVLDRQDSKNQEIYEGELRKQISFLLEENDDDGDEELPEIADEEYDRPLTIENPDVMEDIVDMIISKKLHIAGLKDPQTGSTATHPAIMWDETRKDFALGRKPMNVLASVGSVDNLIKSIIQGNDSIAKALFRYARENKIGTDEARGELATALAPHLGKDEPPITPELAAEMAANITSDQLAKKAESNIDEYTKLMDLEIDKVSKQDVVQVKISGGESQKTVESPAKLIVKFLKRAKDKVIAGEQKDVYSQEEADRELGGDDGLSDEEKSALRKQVRKEMREEALESEYEPGKFMLSQKAMRALMDKIANEMGTSLGNVRNIIYDDLKMMGIDPETVRTMLGLKQGEKLPYGRGKIPPIYDPLLFDASEQIVEKSYEIFRHTFEKYIDSMEDDDRQQAFRKFYEGLYKPGMTGYMRLQDVTGGSKDFQSDTFKKSRQGFEAIQVFIDQLARNFVPEDTHRQAKEGGLRAFILDIKNSGALDIDRRKDFEEFLDKKVKILDRFKRDEDLLFDMLETSFTKSKGRVAKYIKQLEKEKAGRKK